MDVYFKITILLIRLGSFLILKNTFGMIDNLIIFQYIQCHCALAENDYFEKIHDKNSVYATKNGLQ